MATVVLLGTLDTKGDEYAYLRDRVREFGCDTILVDVGVLGPPGVKPDVTRQEVAAAAGADLAHLVEAGDRGAAVAAMGDGATEIVRRLRADGRLHAVLAMGGSGGTSIATQAMRGLPVGVPKLMVSTMAAGDTRPYLGASDITMMASVVDIAGLNRISERILSNAAAAAAGMAKGAAVQKPRQQEKPLVGATMFGVTTACVTRAREVLEARGYEVLVFHATGTGGRSMEGLVREGLITGVLDVTTTELADELVGGILSAGAERLQIAGELGIPQVVSVGALDMVNFGPPGSVPQRFQGRLFYRHNPNVTLMRTTSEECARLGRLMAAKLNRARGPVAVFLPLRGVSALSTAGQPFHDPDADRALFGELKAGLDPRVELVELDADINDPAFAAAMAERLDRQLSPAAG